MPPSLIDIGVNLAHRSFDADRDAVVERALAAGVTKLVITGTDAQSSRHAAQLAATRPGTLWATAGVHPHHARDFPPASLDALRALRPVAIGECGLDFNRNFSPREAQLSCFEAQLGLAIETKLPVFLHERDAFDDLHRIVKAHRGALKHAVVHCFTGDARALDAYLELGLHIGITGWICDDRRGTPLRELVKRIPLERLMLETDAPFLAPPRTPRRNEPAQLPRVLEAVAQARGETPEHVAERTTKTARDFFAI